MIFSLVKWLLVINERTKCTLAPLYFCECVLYTLHFKHVHPNTLPFIKRTLWLFCQVFCSYSPLVTHEFKTLGQGSACYHATCKVRCIMYCVLPCAYGVLRWVIRGLSSRAGYFNAPQSFSLKSQFTICPTLHYGRTHPHPPPNFADCPPPLSLSMAILPIAQDSTIFTFSWFPFSFLDHRSKNVHTKLQFFSTKISILKSQPLKHKLKKKKKKLAIRTYNS